jgi:integration host factor subunit beta
MTKSELILRLSKRFPNLLQRDIDQLVSTFLEEISDTLENGGRVELRGFGAFSVREREPRKARNPKNGKEVRVGKRFSVYFRTGKELKDKVKDVAVENAA